MEMINSDTIVEPIIKWAGGKRWLTRNGHLQLPKFYSRYIEPFLGGGAVFFHLRPEKSVLSDINRDLIEMYKAICYFPSEVMEKLVLHQELHSKEYYYIIRRHNPKNEIERAARFIYLNRTCFNGLYRVNFKGEFNVPIGTRSSVVFDSDNFDEVASVLENAHLICSDFEPIIDSCNEGDFVFVDPPYTTQHNMNGFRRYNERLFSWTDQERLRNAVVRAKDRGACVAVLNADHSSLRALYSGIGEYISVERMSLLAGNDKKRGPTSEAMFLVNYSL